ncbi:MAG: protein TolR [Hydrogenophilales bacterium CG17_big_fil_post_rev_8_21_14_2_50_63_12]|nr:MAG: protein TolR [Hydrogenophilales bacterium CG17_big_fil_post_rev_8_21_14_2_50_63_12]PIX96707.1 MAG: protein TolR [Hydrogenophilales bacterium CG_4_10_14_3_um_filter_63_21]PJB02513.1 MAG: protein TolR [Hydrogenophilales bacterium CG_4_9_14_3_um_filter_63_34]
MIPRRTRKAVNQINVVPYIDVMLVLLVIFMVTAPFINPTQVALPSMGKSAAAPSAPLEVLLREDGSLLLRDRGGNEEAVPVAATALAEAVRARQQAHPGQAVVISADKNVRYEKVMQVMDTLQSLGVARVGLLVKPAQP